METLLLGVLGKFTKGMRKNSVKGTGHKKSKKVSPQQDLETLLYNYLDDGGNSGNNKLNKQFIKKDSKYYENNEKRKKQFGKKNNNEILGDNESDKNTRQLYEYLKILYTLVDKEIKRIDKSDNGRQNGITSLDNFK